jgi:hypothetical protein
MVRVIQIDRICYYTADVSARLDPETPKRQHTYLSALATIPEVHGVAGSLKAVASFVRHLTPACAPVQRQTPPSSHNVPSL